MQTSQQSSEWRLENDLKPKKAIKENSLNELKAIPQIAISLTPGHKFESVESATRAKEALHGCDIYSGCCTLKIEFAKPERLNVFKNDQDSWDYTCKRDDLHKRAGSDWMHKAADRALWRTLGEAYVQQWTATG
ncbi:unnamed protein product [Chrysodeixis includens]|uniref:Uncharacterized protein n=1 Tax=Chrysodeixis includens TaxID=689277 RepID=A0A9N8L4R1_CHRIL|nr:unnamed protein product [Chrysodeixis includens]